MLRSFFCLIFLCLFFPRPCLADGIESHPLLPCLYTLRATTESGSKLVLLDRSGKEVMVDSDARTAQGAGVLIPGVPAASNYGPFSMTVDGSKVIFTKFDSPCLKWGEPRKKFEGLYLWDHQSGRSKLLFDAKTLLDRLASDPDLASKTKSLEAAFKGDLLNGGTSYLFHLGGENFQWIYRDWVIAINLSPLEIKGICLPFAKGDPSPRAWRHQSGDLIIYRNDAIFTITPKGGVTRLDLPKHDSITWSESRLFCWDKDSVTSVLLSVDGKASLGKTMKLPCDMVFPSGDESHFYVLSFQRLKGYSKLSKYDLDAKEIWRLDLKKYNPEYLELYEHKNILNVLCKCYRTADDLTEKLYLMQVDPDSGNQVHLESRNSNLAYDFFSSSIRTSCPLELEQHSVILPHKTGWLAWIPSQNKVRKRIDTITWTGISAIQPPCPLENQYGTLVHVGTDLKVRVLARRPLADSMAVIQGSTAIPLPTWMNDGTGGGTYGITVGASVGAGGFGMGVGSSRPRFFPHMHLRRSNPISVQLREWADRFELPPITPIQATGTGTGSPRTINP